LTFLAMVSGAEAATTIVVSNQVSVSNVKRFGVNLGNVTYYDSGQMMKELVFANPGFEGLLYQSVVQIGSGTSTSAVESTPSGGWPTGFWSGGAYEFIYGAAKGRTGTVVTSLRYDDPAGNTNGTTYWFSDSGATPSNGDYLVLRKRFTGDGGVSNGAAYTGWRVSTTNGATITSELADLPSNTLGRQCVRLTATAPGQSASLSGVFDTMAGGPFVQLNGQFLLSFMAKGVGGSNRLSVALRRSSGPYWINTTFQMTNTWRAYSTNFTAAESGTNVGAVTLQFIATNDNAALLDDVSLRQTDSDPTNTTSVRDAVISALLDFNPGLLRIAGNWSRIGESLDNDLTRPFGRWRSGYNAFGTQVNAIEMSLHEFLEIAEFVSAEPWYTFAATFSTQEMANLMEYLGGPTNTPYGAVRADLGHPAPWTGVFSRIHLEFGNEH
jgi:hypothetical protein